MTPAQPADNGLQNSTEPPPHNLLAVLADHPAFALALVASALVVFRALQFTGFQIPAAIAVLSRGGLEGVIMASAASLMPLLAPVAVILAGLELRSARVVLFRSYWGRVGLWLIVLTGGYVAFFVTPLAVLGWLALALGMAKWVLPDHSNYVNPFSVACGLSAVLIFVGTSAWLPSERITVGSETFMGYVLDESGEWTQILRAGGGVVLARNGQLSDRAVCAAPQSVLVITPFAATLELLETFAAVTQPNPPPTCPPSELRLVRRTVTS